MPELIPLPVLFGNPERVSPNISPDGTQLAWIAPHEGVLNVWLAPVSAQEGADLAAARVITDDTDRGIRQFGWAHDGRHLFYVQDTGGDENFRLHDVDIQTMERRDLTPFEDVQVRLVAMERKVPNENLIGVNRDTPLPDGGFQLMVRDSADAEWRLLLSIPAEDALTTDVVGFSADGQSLLITSSAGAQTARLERLDLATGAVEVLAEAPEADVSGVRVPPDTREPQIVVVLKARSEYLVL